MNAPLITTILAKIPASVTNTKPSMGLGYTAFKGRQATDAVYLDPNGSGTSDDWSPVKGSQTDQGPALAGFNVYLKTMLYVAWKVAGEDTVEVRQFLLASDGFITTGNKWQVLPTTGGKANNPKISTDKSPALA